MKTRILLLLVLLTFASAQLASAQKGRGNSVHVEVKKDKIGNESTQFLGIVGNWSVV